MRLSKLNCLLFLLSVVVLLSSFTVCGFAAKDNCETLISKGCPEDVLESLTDGALEKLNEAVGEYAVGDVEYIPDYTIYKDGKNADYVKCDVLKIGLNNKATGNFEGIAMCVKWELEKKPFIKDDDYISFVWNAETSNVPYKFVYGENSFYAEDISSDGTVENVYNTLAYAGSNEIGHYTDISKASRGVAVFRLNSANEEDVKELSELYFSVNYVHKQETLETVFAVMLPLLFFAAIVFVAIVVRRRKKKLNK